MTNPQVEIKKLDTEGLTLFIEMIRLFESVFEMENFTMPPPEHLADLLRKEDFHVFVALREGRVVGGLTGYVLTQYYSVKPLAYIYDLAIKVELQRAGIGRKLVDSYNEYCRQLGFEEVFVQADQDEPEVLQFYRATDPTEEEYVRHFYYTL